MSEARDTYPLRIDSVERRLPLFAIEPGLSIAVLNILGDTELVEAAATGLCRRIAGLDPDLIVTPEAKSIPLAHAMSVQSGHPYVVLRKSYKSYMGDALQSRTVSITTGSTQTLYLDEKDRRLLAGRRVLLVDDVVSTGSTLEGMRSLMEQAHAEVVGVAAICTEGEQAMDDVIALAHLPLFRT
ncbi:adenine phosphoribosyltransferase [Natronocella acetinitrilica]|uniref:Adenine phosphoribosyltransferase n=1 Tax=Natronocella acetinitrilica TaxID=414046 RepID=A0AAE3G739_9GAMM|nr:phosphoribosyltransferase family protein [Natronocella acetinitrilica]MCP1675057.1 adenine phosphoribosyltransferase [Natronocella acetinitrilica]